MSLKRRIEKLEKHDVFIKGGNEMTKITSDMTAKEASEIYIRLITQDSNFKLPAKQKSISDTNMSAKEAVELYKREVLGIKE
jgi:hypothetical protein